MNQKEFYYYVEEHLADLLKDDSQDISVHLHPVRKTNDIVRYGISIFQNGTNVSPTIYLEEAWEAYQKRQKLDDILQDLVQFYEENRIFSNIRPQMEYEQIEDKIIFSILNKEINQNNLKQRIYTDIGHGLAKVYDVQVDLSVVGAEGTIAITHDMMKTYGYDLQKICAVAEKNTPKSMPMTLQSFADLIVKCGIRGFEDSVSQLNTFYILSNASGCKGAGVLFYEGMQKELASRFGKNYYVLPSSLHEVVLIPEKEGMEPQILEGMVKEINQKYVDREDFLSDKVMYYDKEKEQLRLAIPDAPEQNKQKGKNQPER